MGDCAAVERHIGAWVVSGYFVFQYGVVGRACRKLLLLLSGMLMAVVGMGGFGLSASLAKVTACPRARLLAAVPSLW